MFLDYNLDIGKESVWKIARPTSEAELYPFVVNECGVFYAKERFFTKRYAKNDFQILYTVSGAAEMEYEHEKWRLAEGSIAVIDCNRYHAYRTAGDAGHWTYYWIHISGGHCARYHEILYSKGFQPHIIGADSELLLHFQDTLREIDHTTDIAYVRLSGAVSSIFTKLMVFAHSAPPTAQEASVQSAMDFIMSHFSQPFCMNALAKELNLSKFYLIKLFDKHTGMTPYRYLLLYRVNEAKKLLRATDHKLRDIAQLVGFADVSNFSRTFAKLTGMTPARYRGRE